MLYTTTRNNTETYTACRVLASNRGPDGGHYIPFRLPRFTPEEIRTMAGNGFNRNLAETMNLLFGCGLNGYDVEFTLGRRSVRLQQLGQKIIMGQIWYNTDWCFDRMLRDLARLALPNQEDTPDVRGWAAVGIRIAILFGIFGELIREGMAGEDRKIDLCMVSGDFSAPMACWYAKNMGLPIGNIICCCNENAALWDFFCHGQLRTDAVAVRTLIPAADVAVPDGLERLICLYGGPQEVERYLEAVRTGSTYYVEDGFLQRLRQGIYVTVSSEKRIREVIPSAYSTHGYLLTPTDALAYAGLQDYRARTGEMPTALIMTENSPSLELSALAPILGVSEESLKQYLK